MLLLHQIEVMELGKVKVIVTPCFIISKFQHRLNNTNIYFRSTVNNQSNCVTTLHYLKKTFRILILFWQQRPIFDF